LLKEGIDMLNFFEKEKDPVPMLHQTIINEVEKKGVGQGYSFITENEHLPKEEVIGNAVGSFIYYQVHDLLKLVDVSAIDWLDLKKINPIYSGAYSFAMFLQILFSGYIQRDGEIDWDCTTASMLGLFGVMMDEDMKTEFYQQSRENFMVFLNSNEENVREYRDTMSEAIKIYLTLLEDGRAGEKNRDILFKTHISKMFKTFIDSVEARN
jgi:hypothetical protein